MAAGETKQYPIWAGIAREIFKMLNSKEKIDYKTRKRRVCEAKDGKNKRTSREEEAKQGNKEAV